MILVFSVLLALAVALAVLGFAAERGGAALAGRLKRIGRPRREEKRVDVERDDRLSSMPWLDGLLRSMNLGDRLGLLLYQAGMDMRPGVLVTLMGIAALAGYFLGLLAFHRLFPAVVFMLLLMAVPYGWVRLRKARRMKAFSEQFPDSIDLLVSGLRAGLSFTAAMQIVAEESPEPVRGEFAITVEEQALGLDVRETMTNLTRRVDVMDLRFFATAVLLQRETGGNLAEVLSNSASLIRERFRVLGDIKTFTAQGKLTATVLVLLPIAVGIFTYIAAPEYFRPLLESPGGRSALWVAGAMQLAGVLVIFRIANIKV